MNYILVPSLGHIALSKITITLWNQDDIKTRIINYSSSNLRNKNRYTLLDILLLDIDDKETKEWLKIEEKVLKKATQLHQLPKCLKEKIFGVVKPIGLELLNWMKYHARRTDDKLCGLPNNLFWTSLGKIDIKKTVEVLVKDKRIPIAERYIMACNYCLEDDVKELWNSMPKRMKASFCSKRYVKNVANQLTVIWTYYLKGELAKLNDMLPRDFMSREMSPYQCGFMYAVECGNKLATEYFLKKLNPVERKECFMKYYCDGEHTDVLCFLLSQMNEEEQIAYFSRDETNTYSVLKCLLEWPFQSFFRETYEKVIELELLPAMEFYFLLENIMKKISKGITYRDYNYHKLLEQIWQLSSGVSKLYVLFSWAQPGHVSLLDDMAVEGNIMLILKDADIQMREKIIFNHKSCIISMIHEWKWDTIKQVIQECISSTEMMKKFKDEFITECKDAFKEDCDIEFKEAVLAFERGAWNRFNQVMDELINKKRSIEEGECSQTKKPHTITIAELDM